MAYRYSVQGRAASSNEWNFSQGLERLQLRYDFQYGIFPYGGLRGAFKIDFLVYAPFEIPCEIQGDRWHTGQFGRMDKWRMAIIRQKIGRDPVWFWGRETDTIDKCVMYIRSRLHV